MKTRTIFAVAALCMFMSAVAAAAEWGLKEGSVALKSANHLTFGPDGILFVGDAKAATIYAIDTQDNQGEPGKASFAMKGLNGKVGELLGKSSGEVTINDLAVNPATGNIFLAVTKGDASCLVKVASSGELSKVSLEKVKNSKAVLADAPEDKVTGEGRRRRNNRNSSITDLAFHEGTLLVSGLSSSDSPSTVREIDFPFAEADRGSSVEIYHGAHGRYEDSSPIQTFIPFTIDGKPNVLAGFTCTPLVKFPVASLKPGEKVRGTTVAELGNRNKPLDMIVYKKAGKTFILMANSARGVMKISTDEIGRPTGITERISGTAGQEYDTVEDLKGVVQLDRLNDESAVILVQTDSGSQDLQTIELP